VGKRSEPYVARREYLIEVPHSPEECSATEFGAGAPDRDSHRTAYRGCGAGTHTTWIIAELIAEEEAWSLVPRLLRDTARVVPIDQCELNLDSRPERRSS
jgi:hypothetical protein